MGEDVLEISSYGEASLNGVDTPKMNGDDLGMTLSGYPVFYTQVNKKKHTFDITLGPNENITISTFKDLVAVHINAGKASSKFFGESVGIMGSYSGGILLARDGKTVLSDTDSFGQEWQVTEEEPMLFRTARSPQYPSKCILPTPQAAEKRRLGETMARTLAEDACAHLRVPGKKFENCVFDVMAIGDVEIAADYN